MAPVGKFKVGNYLHDGGGNVYKVVEVKESSYRLIGVNIEYNNTPTKDLVDALLVLVTKLDLFLLGIDKTR